MRNKSFKFKQFEVFHDKCAMKVGTDGVLLGAWASVDNCINVLDVGAGTGLISLMLAQRNSASSITAIEIDDMAALQASENFDRSVFANRLGVRHVSFQDFANQCSVKFDSIVTNPPFFINSLQPDNLSRSNARHTDSLSLNEILTLSSGILSDSGSLSFIYPYDEISEIEDYVRSHGWYVKRRADVYSTPNAKKPKRVLMEVCLVEPKSDAIYSSIVIEVDRHVYSEEYVNLTKEFYLKM